MTRTKKIIIPTLAIITILGAGAYGINQVAAYGNGMGRDTMTQRIAERFGLNKDEVEKVFEEERDERQEQMQANFEARLNDAVSKGELTEEQKKLILAKREEMQSERETNIAEHKNLSQEERQAKMEERRAELEKWAKDNGIDSQYLMMGPGGMGKGNIHGGRGGFMRGEVNNN